MSADLFFDDEAMAVKVGQIIGVEIMAAKARFEREYAPGRTYADGTGRLPIDNTADLREAHELEAELREASDQRAGVERPEV